MGCATAVFFGGKKAVNIVPWDFCCNLLFTGGWTRKNGSQKLGSLQVVQ